MSDPRQQKKGSFLIPRLAIIGVGLIGGSLARALRARGACGHILGYGRNQDNLEEAVRLGVIDAYGPTIADTVRDADMVVVASPLKTNESLMTAFVPFLSDQAVITDVGSAKGYVVDAARKALGPHFTHFVPGHPIAGKETSGVAASTVDLFEAHRVILTPLPETAVGAVEKVRLMWVFRFAAGGFADFTRIASSDPRMWHDICLANRAALLDALDGFGDYLNGIRKAIEANDSAELLKIFSRAKAARDRFNLLRDRRNEANE